MPTTPATPNRAQRRPLAARLNDADWAFLDAQGADNPSEALRQILQRAREDAAAPAMVGEAQARLTALIANTTAGLRTPPRSIVSEDILREAILVLATAMVGPPANGFAANDARLAFEAQIVDRGFDLLDALLRHALTPHAGAWNPEVVHLRLLASRELLVSALTALAREHKPATPIEDPRA